MTGDALNDKSSVSDHLRDGGVAFIVLGAMIYARPYMHVPQPDAVDFLLVAGVLGVVSWLDMRRGQLTRSQCLLGAHVATLVLSAHVLFLKPFFVGVEQMVWGALLFLLSFVSRRVVIVD